MVNQLRSVVHWSLGEKEVSQCAAGFTCVGGVQCRHYHGGGSVGSSHKGLGGCSGDQCPLRGGDH